MDLPELGIIHTSDVGVSLNLTDDVRDAVVPTMTPIGHEKHVAQGDGQAHAESEHGEGDDGADEPVQPCVQRDGEHGKEGDEGGEEESEEVERIGEDAGKVAEVGNLHDLGDSSVVLKSVGR